MRAIIKNEKLSFWSGLTEKERDALAAKAGTSSGYLKQIAYGHRNASVKLCKKIHDCTHGRWPKHILRPDIYDTP